VEEAPAPGLTIEQRRELHAMAVKVAAAAGLRNAATAEFLRSPDGSFYFLEVNTRLRWSMG
jgi:acetyl/propionyl-CoA carboxylase alpha subunit